jgi:dephospho-CoA kinase
VLSVALTGNVASGKSAVARLFESWGATLIDADRIVHELEAPGTPVHAAIVERFGREVVAPDGTLDRARLRARVFADAALRRELEAIVHPAVAAERERRLGDARRRGDRIVVNDIPLLFEVMDPGAFDAVVLVDAPADVRRARLMATRGLDRTTADAMIAAQMPAEQKRGRATFVIDNDGTLDLLRERAGAVWRELERRAPRP